MLDLSLDSKNKDFCFCKLDKDNVEEFKEFYTLRLKEENTSLKIDYDSLCQTIDEDLTHSNSVTFLVKHKNKIVASLKCDDGRDTIYQKAKSWKVDFTTLYELGGICYLGRYCIDKMLITNEIINKGLFYLAICYALERGNYFFLIEGVPRSIRLYKRLGFSPIIKGDSPYIWLEVAELCPMINNIVNFIYSNKLKNQSFEMENLFSNSIRKKLDLLMNNNELCNLNNDLLLNKIKVDD